MSVWNQVRNILLTGICATSLLWPYEAEAARSYDNKRSSRQSRKEQRRTKKRNRKNERVPDRRKQPPRLNSGNPQKILTSLLRNVQNSKELSSEHKELIATCLTELSKTQTGRYIFSNIPDNITLHIIPNPSGQGALGTYNHGHRKACFSDHLIRRAVESDSELKKKEYLLRFTTVIAHELTHATQGHLQLGICPNASYEDYATLRKFREMQAILEEQCAEVELLKLPFFAEVRNERAKTGQLDVFLKRAQDLQIKAGMSPEKARRFARTEFVRSFWSNTPNTPVRVGDELLYTSFVGPTEAASAPWNISYNSKSFGYARRLGPDYYKKTNGTDIRRELSDTIRTIGLDLTPDFIMNKKSFDFESGRLIGYINGIKQIEIDTLGKTGEIFKRFEQGKLCYFIFETRDKDGVYKDYFYDTPKLRATYNIKNGKIAGIYREYDYHGRQILEIPVKNGNGEGKGWILENGKRIPKNFKNGRVLEHGLSDRAPQYTGDYWQQRYIKENQKQR